MSIWKMQIRINAPAAVLAIYIALSVGLLIWHLVSPFGRTLEPIVTGVIAGAFIAILQFTWEWLDSKGARHLKSLKVSNVLGTRDDEDYYRRKIKKSEDKIKLLGSTAARFLADFADGTSPREDKKALLRALGRGVSVQVLIASDKYLYDEKSKTKALGAQVRMNELKAEYPIFEFRYYEHEPCHSIFLVDDSCLVGPIFNGKQSKDTPVIEMQLDSPLVKAYMEYFDREWQKAT